MQMKKPARIFLGAIALFITLCVLVCLSACGKVEEPNAAQKMEAARMVQNQGEAFKQLEDSRARARSNAEVNGRAYMAENPRFSDGSKLVSHGDSTQSFECPQGDGWASLSIMKVINKDIEKSKIKCSTASLTLGCYIEDDFQKKPFASEENKCNKNLPYPLPDLTSGK